MPLPPKILVSKDVIDRLKKVGDGAAGYLVGCGYENNVVILGYHVSPTEQENERQSDQKHDFMHALPGGIICCGAFTAGAQVDEARQCLKVDEDNELCPKPILFTNVRSDLQCHLLMNGDTTSVTFTVISNAQLVSSFIYVRSQAEFAIHSEHNPQAIKHALLDFRKVIPVENFAFSIPTKDLLLTATGFPRAPPGTTVTSKVKDLFDFPPEKGSTEYVILEAEMHRKITNDFDPDNIQTTVPQIRHTRRRFEGMKILLKVDALALIPRTALIHCIHSSLSEAFLNAYSLATDNILKQLTQFGKEKSISPPEIFHFLPSQAGSFISAAYAKSSTDAELKKQRQQLHQSFGFELDQPLFRRSQCYLFERPSGGPLLNPHEGLKSGVKDGQVSLVKGIYYYQHYMQDRFDDNGWGCAYRSLQTIVSWYRLQGYTEVQVPTHKQIQECLVKIGDKPSKFIGSRQWIGSTEVSFVLETLLGVTCKILTASTGEEVGSLGSELAYHFQTHGTPIMIGGGVLAHTIIGVDYNRSTGEIKFLILDPHYTGTEDLRIITSKGWVGWKDSKFWAKNAFYNLCLPLRPVGDV